MSQSPGSATQHAPSGTEGDAERTVAPSGPGGTSQEDLATEARAAQEAGEYAAATAPGLDADAAAPIPADDTEALADPDASSSEL